MANTSSAKKAARKMVRRTEINKSRRSRLKAYVRKVEEALASGDKAAAKGALAAAEPFSCARRRRASSTSAPPRARFLGLPRGFGRWPERGLVLPGEIALVLPCCSRGRRRKERRDGAELTRIQQVVNVRATSQSRADWPRLKDPKVNFHLNVAQQFSVFKADDFAGLPIESGRELKTFLPNFRPASELFPQPLCKPARRVEPCRICGGVVARPTRVIYVGAKRASKQRTRKSGCVDHLRVGQVCVSQRLLPCWLQASS